MKQSTIKLNTGARIPQVGFGTWKIKPNSAAKEAVTSTLEAGYRHIDTARIYMNEKGVGKAINNSSIPRNEIFLTTKLWNTNHRDPRAAFEKSLKRLDTDYIDLYLIHYPVRARVASWKVMEELYAEGKAKAIGVSNFTIRHLTELMEQTNIVPAVNQVEFHPFLYQKDLLEFCTKHGIVVEAYSPLAHGQKLDDPTLKQVAHKYSKVPSQIMIRWAIQHGMVVLPKSTQPERIAQNIDVFDFAITEPDMALLDGLNINLRTCWDPTDAV